MSKGQLSKETLVQGDLGPSRLLPVISLLKLFFYSLLYITILIDDKMTKINIWTGLNVSNFCLGWKSPWTNVSLDKSLLGLMPLGQNGPWTTVPWTNVSTPHGTNWYLTLYLHCSIYFRLTVMAPSTVDTPFNFSLWVCLQNIDEVDMYALWGLISGVSWIL